MRIKCPIQPSHFMVEVAPGMHQCPHCGYGPSTSGHRPYWAISNVEVSEDGLIEAISVRYSQMLDTYFMTGVAWEVDEKGTKVNGSFVEAASAQLSRKDLEDLALPVVIRAKGKWGLPTNKPKLKEGMYPTSRGLKEISLSSAR